MRQTYYRESDTRTVYIYFHYRIITYDLNMLSIFKDKTTPIVYASILSIQNHAKQRRCLHGR